jgi:PAS domain S-box-containing protein
MPRILVADDEEAYRNLLSDHLERKGFDVDCAPNGRKALERLQSTVDDYDVLVTDLMMPEMTGLELLRSAKEHDPWLEVIVITASDDVDNAISAMREDGAYDYLLKPLETIGLLSLAVSRAVQHRSLRIERESLNTRLQEEASRLSALISGTGDAMLAVNGAGMISVANPAACNLLGVEELEGQPAMEVLPAALSSLVENWVALGDRMPTLVETVWPAEAVQLVSLTPIQQEGEGWVMVCRDITHLRNLDELKMRTLTEAAGRIRVPLAQAVSKLVEMGEEATQAKDEVSATVYQLAKLLGRIQTWMDELLAMVRVDAGIGYSSTRIYASEVINDQLKTSFEDAHKDRDLRLEFDFEPDLPELNVDPSLLTKMVQGLIQRAAARSPRGGTIQVVVRRHLEQLWLEITDQGMLAPRPGEEANGRSLSSRVDGVEGEGFGLELVKAIVSRMGGQLWVRGREMIGSTIAISLPHEPSVERVEG